MTHRTVWLAALSLIACDDGSGRRAPSPDLGVTDSATDGPGPDRVTGDAATVRDTGADTADATPPSDTGPNRDAEPPEPDAAPPPPSPCAPLAPVADDAVRITPDDIPGLAARLASAQPGDTFVFAAGEYPLGAQPLRIEAAGVTLRGETGDRDDVVLDGEYTAEQVITIAADDVTVADLTVRRASGHAIHVVGGTDDHTDRPRVLNVSALDSGRQSIRVEGSADDRFFSNDGVVACSHLELTDEGRPQVRDACDTGGIDARGARGWLVTRTEIRGFWCVAGLARHGIHFWRTSRDTTIERNLVLDCARGIGLGLGFTGVEGERSYPDPPDCGDGYTGHYAGDVRNNFVAVGDVRVHASGTGADTGIGLEGTCDARVAHNTVALTMAPRSSAIEWRFAHSARVLLANNLTTHRLIARDGAVAMALGNVEVAPPESFVDIPTGDLHLTDVAASAINAALPLANGVADEDYDGEPRTRPRDVGADERE